MSRQMPADDKSLSWDALIHLKYLNSTYHTFITEAATENLKRDLLDLYRDEQNNLSKLFNVMQARGWYESPQPADANQINQARKQLESDAQRVFSGIGFQPGVMGAQTGIGTQPGQFGGVGAAGATGGVGGTTGGFGGATTGGGAGGTIGGGMTGGAGGGAGGGVTGGVKGPQPGGMR
ncbi:MAG: spore coat protein [Firmicutes bacterium]|nr:spore coat protein [Bacillota bacterium]